MDPRETDRLAQRAQSGDSEALALLYHHFAAALLAYLKRLLDCAIDAEDVLQETFMRLAQGHGPRESRGRFRQWLFTVATNAARDHRQRERLRYRWSVRLDETLTAVLADGRPGPDAQWSARESLALVESALADLPAAYAAAFHLRLREGFSYREMATITGEAPGTLRSRVHHSLKRLRVCLATVHDLPERNMARVRPTHDHPARSEES